MNPIERWRSQRLDALDAKEAAERRRRWVATPAHLLERVPGRRWQDRSSLDPRCAMGVLLCGIDVLEDDEWEPITLRNAWLMGLGWLDGSEGGAHYDYAYWQYRRSEEHAEIASDFFEAIGSVCEHAEDGVFDFVVELDGEEERRAQILDEIASSPAAYARVEDEAFCPVSAAELHARCDAWRRRFEEIWTSPASAGAVETVAEALVLGCRLAERPRDRLDQLRAGMAGAGATGAAALGELDARLGSHRRRSTALGALRRVEAALWVGRIRRARRRLMGTALSRRVIESAWFMDPIASKTVRWAAHSGKEALLQSLDEVQDELFCEALFDGETLAQLASSTRSGREG
jgi:hypothetical protein